MDFRILGPLEAANETGPLMLAGGKQKALLAVLLLHADRVVPIDRIVDDLWGEDVPETANKMVQIFVSQLRKQLPEGALQTRAPGYVLDLNGHSLDLRRFDELVARGRELVAQGRAAEASSHFEDALALWRGPALAEFEEPFADFESSRLEEQRLAALEDRLDADLTLGRHAELVGELDTLVRRHPHRERLRGQLMLALYRSGRHAEALEGYHAFRRLLDTLGIDPPTRLRELERLMLQQDPSLDVAPRDAGSGGRVSITRRRPGSSSDTAPPLGRDRELTHLTRLLDEALGGERRLAFVTGDAGIGKTTIVESLVAHAEASGAVVTRGQCVAQRGAGEPYLAVLEALGALARQPGARELVPLLARQAPTWIAQMPWLLSDEEFEAVRIRLIGATRERMLREMVEALDAISRDVALVLVLEDLHWSDPSTVDLLNALARRREPARLLVVGTYRHGEAVAQDHPVYRLGQELRGRGLAAEVPVGPLGRDAVEQYVVARLGPDASPDVAAVLADRTGGNPLFATTLLDAWVEHGLLNGSEPDPTRLASHVPDTVRDLIEQTLDELDAADLEVLAAASVVGTEFSSAMVAAVTETPTTDVDARCMALAHSRRFVAAAGDEVWHDGTHSARYRFVHDLHREVLYDRLAPAQRAQMHSRVGTRLQTACAGREKECAAKLAEHFVRAADAERAVRPLRLAAELAFERRAHREAFEHVTTALEMLQRLPDTPARWEEELALQAMLGALQVGLEGWSSPKPEAAFARARELAERLGRADDVGWSLFRLAVLYEVRGEYEAAQPLLEQTLTLAEVATSTGILTESHELLACVLFHQGAFDGALDHAEKGLAAYDGTHFNWVTATWGENAGTSCHVWAAHSLWFLGYPDRARARAQAAIKTARDARRRQGLANAYAQAAMVEQFRLDPAATRANAATAMEIASADGYDYRIGMAMILNGWALAAEGAHDVGIEELRRGLEVSRRTGARMDDAYYLALLADACVRAGEVDAGWAAIEEGLAQAPHGRRFFFESELDRLAGELLLRLDRPGEAEARFRNALDVARDQGALSAELRAALSLAAFLRGDGRDAEAREVVAAPYSRFTEGFDTHDLVAARELLEQLGSDARAVTSA